MCSPTGTHWHAPTGAGEWIIMWPDIVVAAHPGEEIDPEHFTAHGHQTHEHDLGYL